MRLLFTVKEAAEILSAFEVRHGRKPIKPKRIYDLAKVSALAARKIDHRLWIILDLPALQAA